jgi:iron complex transport system permease protein
VSSAPLALAAATLLFVVAVGLGVAFGTEPISLARALADPTSLDHVITVGVRVPRVVLGAVGGAGLAVVGAVFQATLRNPLAEPYVLGVSGGAALGATFAIVLGISGATLLGASVVPLAALGGGLAATAIVYALSRRGETATTMLLAGVVVNAIASAAITFLKTLVSASKAQELLFWLMGFLDVPTPAALAFVGAQVAVGVAVLAFDAARLNVLALGEESARALGVDVARVERRVFFAASCVVGAIVSMTGLIGFVGLIVPHGCRRLVGPDMRLLLPICALGGATVLVVCDVGARLVFRVMHTEPPVGAITALVGGPLFLLILRARAGFR